MYAQRIWNFVTESNYWTKAEVQLTLADFTSAISFILIYVSLDLYIAILGELWN